MSRTDQHLTVDEQYTVLNALRFYRVEQERMRDLFIANGSLGLANTCEKAMLTLDRLAFSVEDADVIIIKTGD